MRITLVASLLAALFCARIFLRAAYELSLTASFQRKKAAITNMVHIIKGVSFSIALFLSHINKHIDIDNNIISQTPMFVNKKRGPFIYFHDEENFDYRKVIEEDKMNLNMEMTLEQKVEMLFIEYDNDVHKIMTKCGKLILNYKQSLTK
jgi:hypothetical protein